MGKKKKQTVARDVNTDCFAYDSEKKECKALKETFCRTEDCVFYKSEHQARADEERARQRCEAIGIEYGKAYPKVKEKTEEE